MRQRFQKIFALFCALVISVNFLVVPASASGHGLDWHEAGVWGKLLEFLGGTTLFDNVMGTDHSWQWAANKPQNYYTTPTSSVQDQYGNVTNYYRSGDTTNMNIIDSYNRTFNTIHNTTNNSTTNNYSANVKLENFLNQYTTNNNNYTYSADFKSWYYDNTTNNYNYNQFTKNDYTQNNLYYNQDNSQYYISIDNSTDEYYLIDVQYSPTFVTVNYIYNTTNNNYNEKVGDVTNVYYYELKDGRNSSTLTAAEVAGLDTGYDVANYELVTDDPNTLSLQHFDGDYTDSSSYNRTFYSQNRSTNYVDSGAFGKAVALPNGSAAGVTIPNLSSYSSLSFDFRVYFNDISSLGIYLGDKCIFENVPEGTRTWSGRDEYSDNDLDLPSSYQALFYEISSGKPFSILKYSDSSRYFHPFSTAGKGQLFTKGAYYTLSSLNAVFTNNGFTDSRASYTFSNSLATEPVRPTSYNSTGYTAEAKKYYGWMNYSNAAPVLTSNVLAEQFYCRHIFARTDYYSQYGVSFVVKHYRDWKYSFTPSSKVVADFSYDSYRNQWVSMRITLSGGNLYYFVNGDLVGSGSFTKPTADKFYIKSSGTVYLDELRVATGSLVSTGTYTPSNSPYDTNKVLALPDKLTANTIYVQHNIQVTNCRIGGVRPSNPEKGFLYIPLYDDRTAGQPQLYDGNNWIDVVAMVHNGDTTVNVLGYKFSPVGDSPDVDVDAKPEHPARPSDPDTCTHDWQETDRLDATCSLPGFVEYICSKCEKVKTETLTKLSHTWEIKQSVQTSYDESGNLLTQGFTIYRCALCGEEYKDTDGTGPPSSSTTPGDSSGDNDPGEEGFLAWLLRKIGEFLGAVAGGIIELLKATLGKILDGLIDLVTMAFEKLTQLVDLFGSFGEALGVLWTWLPEEIMLVLVAGVTVFVFVGLLKVFMK